MYNLRKRVIFSETVGKRKKRGVQPRSVGGQGLLQIY